MTLSCDSCVNLTYVELKRVMFSTSRILDLFTNSVAHGDVNESLGPVYWGPDKSLGPEKSRSPF